MESKLPWTCSQCGGQYWFDYGDDICPHCKDAITAHRMRHQRIPSGAHGWIQWKGTRVCMDVHCICGAHMHIDEEFCYFLHCPYCDRVYIVGSYVQLMEVADKTREDALASPSIVHIEKDDDDF